MYIYIYIYYTHIICLYYIYDAFQHTHPSSGKIIRSPSNLARREHIIVYSLPEAPGNFLEAKRKKTSKLNQSGYDGCPGSSWKRPGSFLEAFPKISIFGF